MYKNVFEKIAIIKVNKWAIPNYWDLAALLLVLAVIVVLGWGAKAMLGQYHIGQTIHISLNPTHLPYYALRTVLRMLIALCFSLLFTFTIGTLAAKNRHAERLLIPMIDILQSVPVLGFLAITIVGFVALFPGSMLGPECAAIFAIFVAQVWNMTLSFYQSLRTVPANLREAADIFHLSAWQRFWRVEVPFAMPGLLWNTMMSMSGSWVFLVAAEAFTVAGHPVMLPGIGSYTAVAIQNADTTAIYYVIATMFIVIAIYDQLLFRPLVAWAEKFKAEETTSEEVPKSWVLNLFQRTRWFPFLGSIISHLGNSMVNVKWLRINFDNIPRKSVIRSSRLFVYLWYFVVVILLIASIYVIMKFIFTDVSFSAATQVLYFGLITAIRVLALIIISSLIWVPIGVWIGLHPRASQMVQPIAQFFAAFPVNLLFPIIAGIIIKYHLSVNIWTSPLMILGTQWYILFNVIAGAMALPKNLRQAVSSLNVKGWLWWKRFVLPGIFPYYITGAITAAGGAWNISIVAEAVSWGEHHLYATGLGAYITQVYTLGHFPQLALGIAVMSLFVLTINRLIWRPLYNIAEERYQIR